jgi:hypothetical protein
MLDLKTPIPLALDADMANDFFESGGVRNLAQNNWLSI